MDGRTSPLPRTDRYQPLLLANRLERLGLRLDGALSGKTLDRGGAEEPIDTLDVVDDELRILRLCNRTAMADDESVGVDLLDGLDDALDDGHALVERAGGMGTLVVSPMWATTTSAPARVMSAADSLSKTYGQVSMSSSWAMRIASTSIE